MSSYKLKLILAGASAVCREELMKNVIKNRFSANYKLTVGVDILTKDVEFRPGEIATLSIWDIGGQQRFEFIRSRFYKGAAGVILVFDLTREQTYTQTKVWLTEIRQFLGPNIPFMLIGNKARLTDNIKVDIDKNKVIEFVLAAGGIYIEASPNMVSNIKKAFRDLTNRIIDSRNPN
ncbi:MAG: GTP-binding protein [Promethearchaeota archaeon]